MKLRYYVTALIVILACGLAAIGLLPVPRYHTDVVAMNDITEQLGANFDKVGPPDYWLPQVGGLNYAVVDADGTFMAATRRGLSENLFAAAAHGDTVIDITSHGQVVGKVIFWNDMENQLESQRETRQLLLVLTLLGIVGVCAVFLARVYVTILRPFNNMQDFARRIALGELDVPLVMDKHNTFGAFTESFDLMREELRIARENERAAIQAKRELVASLSHDIQNPVASIQAISELMEVTAPDPQRARLRTIREKSEQIQSLVTELFHTTLDELNSLSVTTVPFPSNALGEMIGKSDFEGKTHVGAIPGCLVRADPVRLSQVIDNVIANSYKYAGTEIDVTTDLATDGLTITLRDHGPGANAEEIPLLCEKYYRGTTSGSKNGYGLGLFIASNLMQRMGGHLVCANADPGFSVRLHLALAD